MQLKPIGKSLWDNSSQTTDPETETETENAVNTTFVPLNSMCSIFLFQWISAQFHVSQSSLVPFTMMETKIHSNYIN